jgi:PD-(D/E)XK nuclease superfamily
MQPSKLAQNIANMPRKHDNSYPLWQGPCGAGPLGGVTQSMLVRFLSCRERFRLRYVLGLEPHDKWNKSTGYGNIWHVCEEALASGQSITIPNGLGLNNYWEVALRSHTIIQMGIYPLQRQEIDKWFNVCCVQFPEYVKYWSQHPDVLNRTPLMQEQVFDMPYSLPSGRTVRLRGKFDSVDLIDGGIYLQENKTKGDVDKLQIERQLKFDLQTMMYTVALLEGIKLHIKGHDVGLPEEAVSWPSVFGIRYNVVKRDCPIKQHEGRMLKAGWKEGETTKHWMERLRDEYYGANPSDYFFRVRAEVSAKDVQVFRETCLDPLLETLCWWYDQVTDMMYRDEARKLKEPPMNYRTPFGIWSSLEEGGSTEYDAFLESKSETGLRRTETLFTELT